MREKTFVTGEGAAGRPGRHGRDFVPPYVGPRGWVGVRLDVKPNWKTIAAIVRESWRMTAPKRLFP